MVIFNSNVKFPKDNPSIFHEYITSLMFHYIPIISRFFLEYWWLNPPKIPQLSWSHHEMTLRLPNNLPIIAPCQLVQSPSNWWWNMISIIYIYIHTLIYLYIYTHKSYQLPFIDHFWLLKSISFGSPGRGALGGAWGARRCHGSFRLAGGAPEGVPSGYVQIAIENGHRNSGFTRWTWCFSIVMFTRGYINGEYWMGINH
jgi:hypothetical protein